MSDKCSVDLTDANFKTVIESNGLGFTPLVICRVCFRFLLFCYVPCLQKIRASLGRDFLLIQG